MAYKISLNNSGGELDSRKVVDEAGTKAAALELIEAVPHLSAGDTIKVEEIAD